MDERKRTVFFGTPLSDSLQDDRNTNDGPINSRRARLNEQQTVRDEQGRKRFHGAFTGGFSAGYFNTVGTVEGFHPKSFVSRRGQDGGREETKFSHKPEDYMDEEDFGEFGIAPKKIRLVGHFDNSQPWDKQSSSGLVNLLNPVTESIGERILRSMTKKRLPMVTNSLIEQKFTPKTNFHGLGYEPLSTSKSHRLDRQKTQEHDPMDRFQLNGFVPAQNTDAPGTCDDKSEIYALPVIDPAWKMPARSEPYIPPLTSQEMKQYELSWQKTHESTSAFTMKFSSNTTNLLSGSETTDIKSGLVSYNDLKAYESKREPQKTTKEDETCTVSSQATISRRTVEWRPCSLLCKHFNIPNPYPDNSYFGVDPSLWVEPKFAQVSTITIDDDRHERCVTQARSAPLELRRSIFNVTFEDDKSLETHDNHSSSGEIIDSEDEPQVLQSMEAEVADLGGARVPQSVSSDDDSDIVVVSMAKPEPELIVLSSSSSSRSSSSPSPSPSTSTRGTHTDGTMSIDWSRERRKTRDRTEAAHTNKDNNNDNDLDDDAYGPPLPPTRERLMNVDNHCRSPSSGTSRKSKKRKHNKRSKKEKKKKKRHKSSKT